MSDAIIGANGTTSAAIIAPPISIVATRLARRADAERREGRRWISRSGSADIAAKTIKAMASGKATASRERRVTTAAPDRIARTHEMIGITPMTTQKTAASPKLETAMVRVNHAGQARLATGWASVVIDRLFGVSLVIGVFR